MLIKRHVHKRLEACVSSAWTALEGVRLLSKVRSLGTLLFGAANPERPKKPIRSSMLHAYPPKTHIFRPLGPKPLLYKAFGLF